MTAGLVSPRDRDRRGDSGAGSVLVVSIGAALILLCGLLVPLYTGVAVKRAVEATADAAALAAADGLSGAVPGYPCELAARVAAAGGAALDRCGVEGETAVVTVSAGLLGLRLRASARGGPSDGGHRHASKPPGSD